MKKAELTQLFAHAYMFHRTYDEAITMTDEMLKEEGREIYHRCSAIADGFIEEQEKGNGTNKHRSRPR